MRDHFTLVAEALENGPEAFAPIIEQYKGAMFGVAWARLHNFHDAEDVTQEAFFQAYQRLGSLRDPHRLGAWLRSIVIHLCLNHIKRCKKTVEVEISLLNSAPTPQVQVDRQALQEQVVDAIGRLSKVQQETVVLFYLDAYSLQEIAQIQEVPVGTIKSRLYEARRRIKKDMIDMVSETMKERVPDDGFAERVFKMLSRYPEQRVIPAAGYAVHLDTSKKLEGLGLGPSTFEGFRRAMASPHWPTRTYAIRSLRGMIAKLRHRPDFDAEEAEAIIKIALKDDNRRVRRQAVGVLGWLDPDRKKRKELMPIMASLLVDKSNHIRRFVSRYLLDEPDWIQELPIEAVSHALLQAPNEKTRELMEQLLRLVTESQRKKLPN